MPAPNTQGVTTHAFIRNQLREAAALYCYAMLCQQPQMRKEQQYQFMEDLYFGNPTKDIMSVAYQLANGVGIFEDLYEDNGGVKKLKKDYYYHDSISCKVELVKNISLDIFEKTNFTENSGRIQGRTLHNMALHSLTGCRKLLAVFPKYFDEDAGEPKLPSGENTYFDVIDKLMKDEYYKTEVAPNASSNASDDESTNSAGAGSSESITSCDNTSVIVRQMWYPKGFLSFLYFGPLARNKEADRTLDFFMKSSPPKEKRKEYGRAAARAAKRKQDSVERDNTIGRGVPTKVQILGQMASIRANEMHMATLRSEAQLIMNKIQFLERREERRGTLSDADERALLASEEAYSSAVGELTKFRQNMSLHAPMTASGVAPSDISSTIAATPVSPTIAATPDSGGNSNAITPDRNA